MPRVDINCTLVDSSVAKKRRKEEKKRSIRAALNTGKYLLQLELFCDENVFFLSFFSLNP